MTGDSGAWLRVDPIACDGRGLCAEALPELVAGSTLSASLAAPVTASMRASAARLRVPCNHARTGRQPTRTPVTANRSTAATCPPVAAAIVITWPGAARKVTLADHGLRVPPAARQQ